MRLIFNKYDFSAALMFFCLFVAAFQTNAQIKEIEKTSAVNLFANASVAGAWRINYAESDNTLLKMQSLLRNQLAQNAAVPKNETQPTLTISLFPPETLVLANENERSMTINEGFNNMILTRTVLTNGKGQIAAIEGGKLLVTATQSKDKLSVETVSPRGNILKETFEITNDGRKLNVTVRVEDSANREMITLKRVYDRTTLEIFDVVSTEIQ